MTFTLVLILIGALLLLVIGINVIQQQKERAEAERRIEFARQRAILDETETVLSNTGMIPCSTHIMLVLYRRVQDALEMATSLSTSQQQADFQRRLADIKNQIDSLQANPPQVPPIENFRLPDNDKQTLVLVQTLKKLKAILRAEHNKGRVDPAVFGQEENRVDSLQLRINVDSMLSRARAASFMKQYGSSKQMVTKALATLHAIKAQTPNDPFIARKVDEAKMLLDEIMGAQKLTAPSAPKPKNEEDDIDMLFQPKKKW
ncbi:flagellar motor control protein ZomB [Shewanella xiamenensis]|uniref:flagellar motor control protein ZomB n=1 Tax=Shewanella xiamenensis TaxID=332186 RepID=UPI0035B718BE